MARARAVCLSPAPFTPILPCRLSSRKSERNGQKLRMRNNYSIFSAGVKTLRGGLTCCREGIYPGSVPL